MASELEALRQQLANCEAALKGLLNACQYAGLCVDNCNWCRQHATEAIEAAAETYQADTVDYIHVAVDVNPNAVRRHLFELTHYLSTWCFHGHHGQCKKRCKMVDLDECDAQCMCDCHKIATKDLVVPS